MKTCDLCKSEIPEDFVNNLCWECYQKTDKANQKVAAEETVSNHVDGFTAVDTVETPPMAPATQFTEVKNGITDPGYVENPQAEDKEQWKANISIFESNSVMLWKPTRQMYTYIKDYNLNKITQHPQYPKFIWKPKIVDVGCGSGVGSNVLSQEADFVWGIDKNAKSIQFAKECFERVKNSIYYSSQVTFDNIDIVEDTRTFAKFDQVVAIEIIEHIDDYKLFLTTIIQKFARVNKTGGYDTTEPTEFFISTPNRNNKSISKGGPRNKYHVREWTSGEFYKVLSGFFENVILSSATGVEIPLGEYETTLHTPLLARCWGPKV